MRNLYEDEKTGGDVGSVPQRPGIKLKKKPQKIGEKVQLGGPSMSIGESRWDASLKMAHYIAEAHGVRAPARVIKATAIDILEWADANNVIDIRAQESTILPIFYEVLLRYQPYIGQVL